ncbi:hypothetical protein I552_7633 [Mycobacterium xenopi 3993]|nr:hypothetical protein I552_7633 [Mycobacterium xenopi 3993]
MPASRGSNAAAHNYFADTLAQQQFTSLLNQQGFTADDIRGAHNEGEQHHRRVGATNEVIKSSYQSAHDSGAELMRQLDTIAEDGNSRIKQIQSSKDPLPIKISKITDVVLDCQTQANIKAATHCDNVFSEIQKVLDQRGIPSSARQFAKEHGIDLAGKFGSPNKEAVRQQVEQVLNASGAPASTQPLDNRISPADMPTSPPSESTSNLGLTPPASPRPTLPQRRPHLTPTRLHPKPRLQILEQHHRLHRQSVHPPRPRRQLQTLGQRRRQHQQPLGPPFRLPLQAAP